MNLNYKINTIINPVNYKYINNSGFPVRNNSNVTQKNINSLIPKLDKLLIFINDSISNYDSSSIEYKYLFILLGMISLIKKESDEKHKKNDWSDFMDIYIKADILKKKYDVLIEEFQNTNNFASLIEKIAEGRIRNLNSNAIINNLLLINILIKFKKNNRTKINNIHYIINFIKENKELIDKINLIINIVCRKYFNMNNKILNTLYDEVDFAKISKYLIIYLKIYSTELRIKNSIIDDIKRNSRKKKLILAYIKLNPKYRLNVTDTEIYPSQINLYKKVKNIVDTMAPFNIEMKNKNF